MKKFTKNSSYKIIQYSDAEYPILSYEKAPNYELKELDVINAESEREVIDIILNNPQVDAIITYSKENSGKFGYLCKNLSPEYKRRWYHYFDYKNHGNELCVNINHSEITHYSDPFFSLTTPLYNTNIKYFTYALQSLINQKFTDWEWVLVDDSPEPLDWVPKMIKDYRDLRVKYYRVTPVSDGCIGTSKWRANCLSRGKWLMEFDHDDMLPDWALEECKKGIDLYPNDGFIYSDDAPIKEDNSFQNYTYGDEYGLGYEYPYPSSNPYDDTVIISNRDTNMNNAAPRHIVGVPNHFRCWRRDIYFKIGGHNSLYRIADDYELLVRTFLETRFIHVNAPCYFQRFDGNNSQDAGNNRADIQRRVRWISNHYNKDIHNKILEYGYSEDYFNNDSFDVMHHYYGLEDAPIINDEYTPEWQKYPFQMTSKQAKAYRESIK